jgi:hypothetical protein
MKFNKIVAPLFVLMSLAGCSVEQIGRINMISTRNIDPNQTYTVLATYSGGSNRELRKSKATSIEHAIDLVVKRVPGGEFLMNAKIYIVRRSRNPQRQRYAVEGDVWGVETEVSYRGFKVGDRVMWKAGIGKYKSGVITSLKDDRTCLVETEDGAVYEKKYVDISKAE